MYLNRPVVANGVDGGDSACKMDVSIWICRGGVDEIRWQMEKVQSRGRNG